MTETVGLPAMNTPLLLLYLLTFLLIVLTPRVFFRKGGTLNLKWWLTALPFALCPAALIVARVAELSSYRPQNWDAPSELLSVLFAASSLCLLSFTLGTHQVPISLWHQSDDAPEHIVTEGAYSRIRHPFYASYLLALVGSVVLFPHWATIGLAIYAGVVLTATAVNEERKIINSEYGAEYARYIARTGRFLPRLRAPKAVISKVTS